MINGIKPRTPTEKAKSMVEELSIIYGVPKSHAVTAAKYCVQNILEHSPTPINPNKREKRFRQYWLDTLKALGNHE